MPPGPIHSTNPTQISIVEDSATQAERLKYSLEQTAIHSSCRRNGQQALESMRAAAPTAGHQRTSSCPRLDGYDCAAESNRISTSEYPRHPVDFPE